MLRRIVVLLLAAGSLALVGCASPDTSVGRFKVGKPYSIAGQTYYPEENYTFTQEGIASWYGPGFDGKKTANGERFDEDALTAAHPTLQMPSLVRVTNLANGNSLIVRVNDRGPFHGGRVMDLSKGAADQLGFRMNGTARVRLQVLGPESQALAEAAKRGIDTRGAEIAANQTGTLDERFAAFYPTYVSAPQPAIMVASNAYQPQVPVEQSLQVPTLAVPRPPVSPIASIQVQEAPIPPVVRQAQAIAQSLPKPEPRPMQIMQMAPVSDEGVALSALPVSAPAAKPLAVMSGPAYYVQAGSFMSKASAEILRDELASFGQAEVIPVKTTGSSQSYFRVRIGPMADAQSADTVVNTLQSQGRRALRISSAN